MLDFFGIRHTNTTYSLNIRYLHDLNRSAIHDLNTVMEKNNRYPYFVPSNHILAQYLSSLEIDTSSDDFSFYSDMKSKVLYHASNFGLTTNINNGIIHNGAMYGTGKDILIGYSGIHNPSVLSRSWENLSPIRVIRHHYKNYDLQPIVKQDKVSNPYTNVFLIDLMSLVCQYRQYLIRSEKNRLSTGIDQYSSVTRFLSRYPLNNLLYSHLGLCLLNNIYSYYVDGFIDRPRFLSMMMPNYSTQMEYIKNDYPKALIANSPDIDRVLCTLSVLNDRVYSLIDLKGIDLTRQNSWAFVYSFLPHLQYTIAVGNDNTNKLNYSKIKLTLDRMKNDSVWSISTIRYTKQDMLNEVDAIYKQIS